MTTTLDHDLLIVALAVDLRFAEAEPMARAVSRWLVVGRGSLERWLDDQKLLTPARFRSLEQLAALWLRDRGDPRAAAQRLRLDPQERAILSRIHPAAARLLATPPRAIPASIERGRLAGRIPFSSLLAWTRSATLAWLVVVVVASTSAWRIQALRHLLETRAAAPSLPVGRDQPAPREPSPESTRLPRQDRRPTSGPGQPNADESSRRSEANARAIFRAEMS